MSAQRDAALARANEVRLHRARLKRRVTAAEVGADDVLLMRDDRLDSMRVIDLLLAIPAVGPGKARRILATARVSERARLGSLTARQRGALLVELRARRPRRVAA